eukprot:4789014-Amphidinium_carterae.1
MAETERSTKIGCTRDFKATRTCLRRRCFQCWKRDGHFHIRSVAADAKLNWQFNYVRSSI